METVFRVIHSIKGEKKCMGWGYSQAQTNRESSGFDAECVLHSTCSIFKEKNCYRKTAEKKNQNIKEEKNSCDFWPFPVRVWVGQKFLLPWHTTTAKQKNTFDTIKKLEKCPSPEYIAIPCVRATNSIQKMDWQQQKKEKFPGKSNSVSFRVFAKVSITITMSFLLR